MGLKHYKNLTWQTKGRQDECTNSPRARLTDSTTLLQHPPPKGLTWRPLPNPWRASSGTELDNETNQDSKPPMFFSRRSNQKPGYRQVPVRIFWSVLRYAFKNLARIALMIIRENKIIDQFPTPKHQRIWLPFWKLSAFNVIITARWL